jgi:hypothetical protein
MGEVGEFKVKDIARDSFPPGGRASGDGGKRFVCCPMAAGPARQGWSSDSDVPDPAHLSNAHQQASEEVAPIILCRPRAGRRSGRPEMAQPAHGRGGVNPFGQKAASRLPLGGSTAELFQVCDLECKRSQAPLD